MPGICTPNITICQSRCNNPKGSNFKQYWLNISFDSIWSLFHKFLFFEGNSHFQTFVQRTYRKFRQDSWKRSFYMPHPVACYIMLLKAARVWWTLVLLDFSFGWLFSNLFDTYPFYHGLIMWQEFQVNCSLVDINGKILAGKHGMTRFVSICVNMAKIAGNEPMMKF